MLKELFSRIDQFVTSFLLKYPETIPTRWAKFLAYFYPDARVRKTYLSVYKVSMGEGTYANYGLKVIADFTAKEPMIIIGNNVSMGPNILIISESSPNNSKILSALPDVKERMIKNSKVIIEDDVWIGAGVTILPGVKIGKCAIVGAGSLITRDIEAYSIVVGSPGKVVRQLNEPI